MAENENSSEIEEIMSRYLEELLEGGDQSEVRERFLAEYPDLQADLTKRMDFVKSVFEIAGPARHSPDVLEPDASVRPGYEETRSLPKNWSEGVTRILCPHCGNHLKLITEQAEITCGSCGSIVTIDSDGNRTDLVANIPPEINGFKIDRLLGKGGFGVTYLAFDVKLARCVAIKIPRRGEFLSNSERERFEREARSAAKLRHPSIVAVHEIGEYDGVPYIVCDYIEGITLSDLISGRMLTHRETAELIAEVADAVHYAHEQKILHRDLKPSNILLNLDNKPFVADFGLALNLEAEITMTMDGEILGTPAYMSPEQASGRHHQLTVTSDVYSLGVTLYRLLCSELPFRGSKRMMLHQVICEDPKPPRKINDKIPVDLQTITLKAMAKEPENRYLSAKQLADDLRRWLSNHPIQARPASSYSKLVRWCRRNKKTTALIGIIAGLLLVITVISAIWAVQNDVLSNLANQKAQQALDSEMESTRRLTKSHVQNGLRELESGVQANAVAWWTEALKTEIDDDRIHRTRIGMVLDRHPILHLLHASPQAVEETRFGPGGTVGMIVSGRFVDVVKVQDGNKSIPTLEHETPVLRAKVSPAGNRIVTLPNGNRAYLWNGQTGERVAELSHSKPVKAMAFDPPGAWIATVGRDKFARVWNSADGSLVAALEHPHEEFDTVQFLADGLLLTSLKTEIGGPSEFRIWDVNQKKLVVEPFPVGRLTRLVATDEKFAVATMDGNVQFWDLKTGQPIGAPIGHSGRVQNMFFDSNSDLTTTVQYDGTISSWNRTTGRKRLVKHPVPILDSASDPQNRFLAVAGTDGNIAVYWQHSLEPVCANLPVGKSVNSVDFDPQGRQIIGGSNDGMTRIWDLSGLAPDLPLMQHADNVNLAKWSPDDERIVSISDDQTGQIWNSRNGSKIGPPLKHDAKIADVGFNRDGRIVATAGFDNQVRVWDGRRGTAIGDPIDHSGNVVKLQYSPVENLLVTGTDSGSIAGWVPDETAPRFRAKHADANITDIKFSPDGSAFATASIDESAAIWDSATGQQNSPWLNHSGAVNRVGFSNAGDWFLTCGMDKVIKLWRSKQPYEMLGEIEFVEWPYSATFNSNGTRVLASNYSGSLSLWENQDRIWEFQRPKYYLSHAVFDPDERFALTCGTSKLVDSENRQGKGAAFLVDAQTGQLIAPPFEHFGNVNRAYFDFAGKRILTSSHDSTIRVWNVIRDNRSAEEIEQHSIVLSGKRINDQFRLVNVPPAQLVEKFIAARQKQPTQFKADQREIERWEEYVKWVVGLEPTDAEKNND